MKRSDIYRAALAEGRSESEAFALADAWEPPEQEPAPPRPGQAPEPTGGDPLLRAAELADARDAINAKRARGARVLLEEAGGGSPEDLAELSDAEILAAVDRQAKERAAADEANDLDANQAAAAAPDVPAWSRSREEAE